MSLLFPPLPEEDVADVFDCFASNKFLASFSLDDIPVISNRGPLSTESGVANTS
jgi:hypothetical protein